MELVGREVLDEFKKKHADARGSIERWERVTAENQWRNFSELRQTIPSADQIKLDRELVATIFNIGGNKYRLVTEVIYGLQLVRALLIMTHAEYDKGRWKKGLVG